VVEALRESGADVVCLQEVRRFAVPAARARRLARESGLVAVGSGRLAGDTAIFVTDNIVVRRHRRLDLSRTPDLHRRGATIATLLDPEGLALTVASVHLGLDAQERERHVAEIVSALVDFDRPHLVAGDINEGPGGAAWQALVTGVGPAANTSEPTFPAMRPVHVLDACFVGAPLVGSLAIVLASTASDHRAVAVAVRSSREEL